MPKAQFEIYRAQVFELAKTLIVKSSAVALTINDELSMLGVEVNQENFSSWKYYLNLAGQYHSYDTVMTVVSLDTLQTIEFTVENLQIHRATAAAYAFGSRYYNELVERYPDQEPLIQRVLNPIDMQTAIAAIDGEVLWYAANLVEDNETNLIERLQVYINGVFARWNVAAYQLTDDLYVPSFTAMLYNFLPTAIMNIRNGNCHTRYAHSYHIKEFLTSHGQLNEFIDNLTKSQLLWLYRNIRYIHHNPGKQDTLEWMIDNLLTVRRIPIAEWEMTHDLSGMPDQLYPRVEFERNALNLGYHVTGSDTKTVERLLDDEVDIARGNATVQDETERDIQQLPQRQMGNHFKTKVLESAMIDMQDSEMFSWSEFILHHWLYLSHVGRYNSFITFDDPRTGESTALSVKDAFTVFLYAINRGNGVELTQVPTIQANMVRRIPKPSEPEIRQITQAEYLSSSLLASLSDLPEVGTHISVAGFRENMQDCFDALMRQYRTWAGQDHYQVKGQAEIAGLHFYHDVPIDLGEGTDSYYQWLTDRALPYADYTEFECQTLAATILAEATGSELTDVISIREMQAALLRLLARLSSYAIQFLKQINVGEIRPIGWHQIAPGDIDYGANAHLHAKLMYVQAMRVYAESKSLEQLSIYNLGVDIEAKVTSSDTVQLELTSKIQPYHRPHVLYRMLQTDLRIQNVTSEYPNFETDTSVRESEHYKPLVYQELQDAFIRTETDHYTLTPSERIQVELLWLEYQSRPPITDKLPEPYFGSAVIDGAAPLVVDALHSGWLDGFNPTDFD